MTGEFKSCSAKKRGANRIQMIIELEVIVGMDFLRIDLEGLGQFASEFQGEFFFFWKWKGSDKLGIAEGRSIDKLISKFFKEPFRAEPIE